MPLDKFIRKNKAEIEQANYVIVKCTETAKYVFNRFNPQASSRAQSIRNAITPNTKPLSILVIVFDSISMTQTERFMPKTVETLRKVIKTKYNRKFSVFEFGKSSVMGVDTRTNIIPFYSDNSQENMKKC
jgi:hypothetical protein